MAKAIFLMERENVRMARTGKQSDYVADIFLSDHSQAECFNEEDYRISCSEFYSCYRSLF